MQDKDFIEKPISKQIKKMGAIAYRFSIGIEIKQLAIDFETSEEDIEEVLREVIKGAGTPKVK